MSWALVSLLVPLLGALLLIVWRPAQGLWACVLALGSVLAALLALHSVLLTGPQWLAIGGWEVPLGIRLRLTPLSALLLVFTATLHLLVALYASRRPQAVGGHDFWPLGCLLQASLMALWLSADLFNLYVTLELLSLAAVAMVALAGPRAYGPALDYLLLSLAGSLCWLLGVALIYGRYGVLDIPTLQGALVDDGVTRWALLGMTVGLMLKGALWPLHLWLPPAHAGAPSAVSALLSGLVVKGPLYLLWLLWHELAPDVLAHQAGLGLALLGAAALLFGGWAALRTPWLKKLVAFSTVAQLGYALLALGLLLVWEDPYLEAALWLFVLAHGLAKVSLFLAVGEFQATLGGKRVLRVRGASQLMPVATFAFLLAGGSLVGLPPSGGFLAKWLLLQPLVTDGLHWGWILVVLAGTGLSAAYVFRVVTHAFDRRPRAPLSPWKGDVLAQWWALLPALLAWCLALISPPLLPWLVGVGR